MKNIGKRGQIWTDFIMGIMVIIVLGLLYVMLNQVYVSQFKPMMVTLGVNSDNANVVDFAWRILLIPVLLAVVYSWINTSRRRMSLGYE